MRVKFLIATILGVQILCGCDRAPAPAAMPSTRSSGPVFELELKPLTPLLPNRPTHIAVDHLGNVYWVQESDRDDDTLFVIGEGDIPRATQLSAANIAATMGVSGGRGNIHAIAPGPQGEIYFYFCGNLGRQTIACLGQYLPRSAKIRILADTETLSRETNMGRSLALARGAIVFDRRFIWTWVRHTDASAIFRFEPIKAAASGPIPLLKPFTQVKLGDKNLPLTNDELEISAGPDTSLCLLDTPSSRLLKIDTEGRATVLRSLAGLPSVLSTPAFDRNGQIVIFGAGNADPLPPASADQAEQAPPTDVSYPAMLIFGKDSPISIGRDRILAYPGFPIFGMRLRHLIPNPGGEEWITYDSGSGELLRLKIRERLFP